MLFDDRFDAGRRLANALAAYRDARPLVLAIPRGGVPLGRVVADDLAGDLDVVLVRKIGAPFNPEFAVGSVGESGKVFVADFADRAGADQAYVNKEAAIQLETIHRRRALYTSVCPSMNPQGRTVIVVDDGLATGATMRAALAEVRDRHPARLICAVPVASAEAASRIRERCDEVICLAIETDFQGVGQFYRDFSQVSDDTAVSLLKQS